jgi:hypothetical protein
VPSPNLSVPLYSLCAAMNPSIDLVPEPETSKAKQQRQIDAGSSARTECQGRPKLQPAKACPGLA